MPTEATSNGPGRALSVPMAPTERNERRSNRWPSKPAADPWTDRLLLGIDREELARDRRDGPVQPLLVRPADVKDQRPVGVGAQVEQEQVGRPLRCQAIAERRLRDKDLEDRAMRASAHLLMERPDPR